MSNRVKKDRSAIRKARKANRSYINKTFKGNVKINESNIGYLNEMSITIEKNDVKEVAKQAIISDLRQEPKQEKIDLEALKNLKIERKQELNKVTRKSRSIIVELARIRQASGDKEKILDENGELIEEREVQEKAVVTSMRNNITKIKEDEELAV